MFRIRSLLALVGLASVATAAPWLEVEGPLKADLHLLASAGFIRTPLMTWPLPVASLKADLARYSTGQVASRYLPAFNRVRRRLELETEPGFSTGSRVEWANEHRPGAGISSLPNQTRLAAGPTYLNNWLAAGLKVNRILEPTAERDTRFDDSYLAAVLDNWMLGAGEVREFWGPQWASSLTMDTLQAPVQSIWLSRNQAIDNGFGPWGLKGVLGRNDESGSHQSQFQALRFDWRPIASLEWSADFIRQSNIVPLNHWSSSFADSEMDSRQWGSDLRWQWAESQTFYGQWQQSRLPQQQQTPFALGWIWGLGTDSGWLWYLEFQRQSQAVLDIELGNENRQLVWGDVKPDRNQQLAVGAQIRGLNQGDWHWQLRHQSLSQTEMEFEHPEWVLKLNHGTPCFGFSCRFHLGWQSDTNQSWSIGLVWDSKAY